MSKRVSNKKNNRTSSGRFWARSTKTELIAKARKRRMRKQAEALNSGPETEGLLRQRKHNRPVRT